MFNVLVFISTVGIVAATKFAIPDNYSPRTPPCLPTKILCYFSLHQVKEVNDLERFVTLDIALYLNWTDPRFRDESSDVAYSTEELQHFVDPALVDHIWKPDLFFYQNREVALVNTYDSPVTLEVYPATGEVKWWLYFRIRIDCNMKFDAFPLDSQRCPIILGSLSATKDVQVFDTDFNMVKMIADKRNKHMLQHGIDVDELAPHEKVTKTFT